MREKSRGKEAMGGRGDEGEKGRVGPRIQGLRHIHRKAKGRKRVERRKRGEVRREGRKMISWRESVEGREESEGKREVGGGRRGHGRKVWKEERGKKERVEGQGKKMKEVTEIRIERPNTCVLDVTEKREGKRRKEEWRKRRR